MIFADIRRFEIVMDGFAKFFRANFKAYPTNPTEFYKLAAKLIPIQLGSDTESPLTETFIHISPDYERGYSKQTEFDTTVLTNKNLF